MPRPHPEAGGLGEESSLKAIQIGGGDEDLLIRGKIMQQVGPAPGIQLREDIVQEQNGLIAPLLPHEVGLGQPKG